MKWLALAILCLAAPSLASAASGDSCGTLTPPTTADNASQMNMPTTCIKLIDGVTVSSDSSVVWVPVQQAGHVVIKVVSASNAGAACTFDDWGVYEQWTSATPAASTTFGALCALDDDGSSSLAGAGAAPECKIFGPVGPYLFIDGGTLGTCANGFSVWAWFYAPEPNK